MSDSSDLHARFDRVDSALTVWMARWGVVLLRVSVGVVFLWFGALKFFPGLSPAEDLATGTIDLLTGGVIGPRLSLPVLAAWETAIGVGLITGRAMRLTLFLLATQMAGTLTPLVLFPDLTWQIFPVVPTIEGQYIIKNAVLVSAGLVIGATVRGGNLVADPEMARSTYEAYQRLKASRQARRSSTSQDASSSRRR